MPAKRNTRELVQFGTRLRKLRIKKRMTQNELAAGCDIDVMTIKRLEKGVANPTLNTIVGLAKVLGVPVRAFF